MVTVDRLKELLYYAPNTGRWEWRVPRGRKHCEGSVTGLPGVNKYGRISIDGKAYLAHRLAWLYVYGEWPLVIDHIDGNPSNNSITNLRNVTQSENSQNEKRARKNSKTGFLGVYRSGDCYVASIKKDNKTTHLGTFESAEKAHSAYLKAKRSFHIGCTI